MAVLGSVVTIESNSATLTFVCVVVFLVWLDEIIHYVESSAKKSGYQGIFHKVNKEMMILGLVSFATFVLFEAVDPNGKNTVWYVYVKYILLLFSLKIFSFSPSYIDLYIYIYIYTFIYIYIGIMLLNLHIYLYYLLH